ncbi:hypothetical protein PRZ48_005630 [Zasmidium cellare]|uniref:Uncharacterized protein n=1 Tax=Zasmidium cellare TaxID=395010 RepID=A0ABR0EL28_ZASCE|nr:hypothetical protein PRZ48_005630 [Zasmidium cellare]
MARSTFHSDSQPSMELDVVQVAVVKVANAKCDFTTTDKNRCGDDCAAKPISVFADYGVTQYSCMPKETASPTVIVTPVATVVIAPEASTTRTLPVPGSSTKEAVPMGTCGETVRVFTACPTQCPASVIPGGVGAIYSCVDPSNTSSKSSTPATAAASTTPASTTPSTTAASTITSPSPTASPPSTFETSVSETRNFPTATQNTSTSSTPSPVQISHSFEQTSAGKAAIAASLISGVFLITLAIWLWRRHKRSVAAKRGEPETIMLRSDVGNRKSDGTSNRKSDGTFSDDTHLSVWEVLTNTTREEFHAQRGAELRQAQADRESNERNERYRREIQEARRNNPEAFPY